MLWSIDSCQNKVSADQYHLTVSRARVSTHRGQVFFWSYPLTRYWFSNNRRLKFNFFLKFIRNMLCLCAAKLKFWFQTDLGRENSASCYRQGRQLLLTFLAMFTRWHALRAIFMLWLLKIWQVSSCGKFMLHLESCLLWQLKLTEFCVNLCCF